MMRYDKGAIRKGGVGLCLQAMGWRPIYDNHELIE